MADRLYRQSDIGNYLWCRRNYWFAVNRRLRPIYPSNEPVPAFANALGSLAHHGVYYAAIDDPEWKGRIDTLAGQLCWPDAEEPRTATGDWPDTIRWATRMVDGWLQWREEYGQEYGIETLAAEERLYAPVGEFHGDKVTITFKPDRVQMDHGLGRALIIDDVKTTQKIETAQTHNRQLMTYAILYRLLTGDKVQYLSTTQLLKSMRTKGGPLSQYYGRTQIYVTDDMYSVAWDELSTILGEMVALDQALDAGETRVAIQNPGRDCGWKCRYEAPCITHNYGGDVEATLLNDYKKVEVETDG